MGTELRNRNTLLLTLAFLIGIKFGIVPIMEWQGSEIKRLAALVRQNQKLSTVVENRNEFEGIASALQVSVVDAESLFYPDQARIKLDLQKAIEDLFISHSLNITRFDWVFDSPGSIRTLRAKVHFAGEIDNMITAFWSVAVWPKLARQVEWQQQMSARGTNGRVTLEFYASENIGAVPLIDADQAEVSVRE